MRVWYTVNPLSVTIEAPEIHYRDFQVEPDISVENEDWWKAGAKLFGVYFNPRIFVQVMDDQVPYTNIYLAKNEDIMNRDLPSTESPCFMRSLMKMQL